MFALEICMVLKICQRKELRITHNLGRKRNSKCGEVTHHYFRTSHRMIKNDSGMLAKKKNERKEREGETARKQGGDINKIEMILMEIFAHSLG